MRTALQEEWGRATIGDIPTVIQQRIIATVE